jgi:hypothetical protein
MIVVKSQAESPAANRKEQEQKIFLGKIKNFS